jgi:hypothetical protein
LLVDLGDLGLRGWQSLSGFLVFRVVRVDDLDQVLLTTHTRSWLSELFLLCCKLLLPPHRDASPFHHLLLSFPLLPLLKALSWSTTSRSISQLFWSATGGFAVSNAN